MRRFTNAFDAGLSIARRNVINYERPEEFIFVAMENNPFKSEKSRKSYIEGVSSWVNTVGELRNRKMNGGA